MSRRDFVGATLAAALFASAGCGDVEEITSKISEHDRNKDGIVDLRFESITRGTNLVMRVKTELKAGNTNITRFYYVSGECVLIESDENGDSVPDTLVIENPLTKETDVFKRGSDGQMRPVSSKELKVYREQMRAVGEFFEKAFARGATTEEGLKMLQETQTKVQKLQEELK